MAYNYQPYRVSGSVTNYKNKQDTATRNYNNYANTNYSAGAGGLGNEVKTAQDRLNALYRNNNLSQQFKYSKQSDYDKALSAISNRKAFQYDLSDDMLFQQAKEQYQQMGKTAMADTIGQASAMTGGYGNSYATTAGAQAYNNYLQELNNSIGDYYSMALSTYNNETDRLNSIYNAYATDRSTEASEWTNNWNVYNQLYSQYYNQYSDMLNKDMSAWEQKGNNLYNAANLATSQYSTASSNDINVWNSQEQLRAEQASQIETERANRAEEAYRNASLQETIRANKASEQYNNAALAETIRANKASEQYNTNKLAWEKEYSRNYGDNGDSDTQKVKAERTTKTSNLIKEIDREIQNSRYRTYGGDYEKAKSDIAKEMVKEATDNGTLTDGEALYLIQYYNLD